VSTNPTPVSTKEKVVCPADESLLLELQNRKMGSRESFATWKALRQKTPRVKKPKKVAKLMQPCSICGEVLVKKLYCSDACKQVAYRRSLNTPVALMHREEKAAVKRERRLRRDAYKSIGFDGRYGGPERKDVPLHNTQDENLLHAVVRAIEVANEKVKT
jgi:hypothetical protein